jgi:probable rRNA maturation factor
MSVDEIQYEIELVSVGSETIPTEAHEVVTLAKKILTEIGQPSVMLSVVFVSATVMQNMNNEHRGIDAATDVLSFPIDQDWLELAEVSPENFGDVVICQEVIRKNAESVGLEFKVELNHVIVHGLLHLLGHVHDDEGSERLMSAIEEDWLGEHIH